MAVVAVTVGVVLLHEPFSIRLVIGGLLIVAGSALISTRLLVEGRAPA